MFGLSTDVKLVNRFRAEGPPAFSLKRGRALRAFQKQARAVFRTLFSVDLHEAKAGLVMQGKGAERALAEQKPLFLPEEKELLFYSGLSS